MLDNEQAQCNAIRFKITGDDGGCWEKCGPCKGTGDGFTGDGRHCPDCNGTGRVERRERIAAACFEWMAKQDDQTVFKFQCSAKVQPDYDPSDAVLMAWDNRKGQPWQSALEAFVAEYREDAPKYNTEAGMVLLLELLRDADAVVYIRLEVVNGGWAISVGGYGMYPAYADFGEALFQAVLKAIGETDAD